MNGTPTLIRFLITNLIALPGRLVCLAGLAFSLFFAVTMIYGIRTTGPKGPWVFIASLGAMALGSAMVMFAAVFKQSPDEAVTARQAAVLAALGVLNEVLGELSALLLLGAAACLFGEHRTAGIHLGIGAVAAFFAICGIHSLEKRFEPHGQKIPP